MYNIPCGQFDKLEVGGLALAQPEGLGRGVDADEDQVSRPRACQKMRDLWENIDDKQIKNRYRK